MDCDISLMKAILIPIGISTLLACEITHANPGYSITYPNHEVKNFEFGSSEFIDVEIGGYNCTFSRSSLNSKGALAGAFLETVDCSPLDGKKFTTNDIQAHHACIPGISFPLADYILINQTKLNLKGKTPKDSAKQRAWKVEFKCE